jgi:hypothetical protein
MHFLKMGSELLGRRAYQAKGTEALSRAAAETAKNDPSSERSVKFLLPLGRKAT